MCDEFLFLVRARESGVTRIRSGALDRRERAIFRVDDRELRSPARAVLDHVGRGRLPAVDPIRLRGYSTQRYPVTTAQGACRFGSMPDDRKPVCFQGVWHAGAGKGRGDAGVYPEAVGYRIVRGGPYVFNTNQEQHPTPTAKKSIGGCRCSEFQRIDEGAAQVGDLIAETASQLRQPDRRASRLAFIRTFGSIEDEHDEGMTATHRSEPIVF